MSETKRLVKCALGFLIAIIMIVGGAFGLDVQVKVQDATTDTAEVVETTDVGEATEGEDVEATEEVAETEEQSTVESTPTEDEVMSADDSVEAEVTEPTDEPQNTVTEGEN
jgi:cytoskeletal protein RodZ